MDTDILRGCIEAQVLVNYLIKVRSAPQNEKQELLDAWCPSQRQWAEVTYFACSDQDLQCELAVIADQIDKQLAKIDLKTLGDIII